MARKKEEVLLIDDDPEQMGERNVEETLLEHEEEQMEEYGEIPQEILQEEGLDEQSLIPEIEFEESESALQPPLETGERETELTELIEQAEAINDVPDHAEDVQDEIPAETVRSRRRTRRNANQVLAIDEEVKTKSAEEEENQLWLELRNAQRGRRILSGTLSGIERLENGLPMAIVYYKGMRVAIPATEMMLYVTEQENQTELELYNRYAQLLSRMLAAEIDFMIAGIDRRNDVVLGSRKQAMERKQQRYYLNPAADGEYLIQEGQIVEARINVVSDKLLRLEVFGVECNVLARDLAWEWVEDAHDYFGVGDRVLVKIKEIHRDDPERLRVAVSVREATANPSAANLSKCSVNGKYIGTVTGVENVVYVRLNIGVNAIATTVRDQRAICRKDEVSFVVTRIDETNGLAVGIITRIIKQAN